MTGFWPCLLGLACTHIDHYVHGVLHILFLCRGALVCSVPGYHQGADIPKWGHMALRTALSKVSLPPGFEGVAPRAHNSSSKDLESAGSSAGSLAGQMTHGSVSVPGSSLVAQFSSLGKVDEEWLLGEFGRSLAASAQGPSGTGVQACL